MPIRDIQLNATEDFPLSTVRIDTGAPTDVASIVVSAYPDNSATQLTAGITVTAPDSIAGYANIRVVATVANGYAFGVHYTLVITTGTVNSVSVVGMTVGEFTIRKNVPGLVRAFIAQASTSTTIVFDAATSFADNFLNGHFVVIVAGTGAGQSRFIDSWTNSTDTATVSPAWTTTPDTTSVCECYATPPASTGTPVPANTTQWLGTAVSTPTNAGVPNVNVKTWNDLTTVALPLIPTVAGRTLDVSATGEGGVDWANVGSPTTTLGLSGTTILASTTAVNLTTNNDKTGYTLSNTGMDNLLTRAMTESYAADGATMTVAQALYLIIAHLGEKAVSSTTVTLKKLDGSTSAATFTLDSASAPTSITRAS